jgi:drug/metabolite transporter (DMT)-like permease
LGIYEKDPKNLKIYNFKLDKNILSGRSFAMLLMVLGSTLISFTGLIVRGMDSAGALQINLYRGLALSLTILVILFLRYRSNTLLKIAGVGMPGIIAGSMLALAGICLIQAITTTTVAATLFICASIPFISAFLAWFLLNEKISTRTLITMVIAAFGVCLMMFSGFRSNSFYGTSMALITALSFSGYAIVLRKNRDIEMLPSIFISGFVITLFCVSLLGTDIVIPWPDLFRCILLGSIISLIPNSLFIYASKYLIAAELTLFMLLEFGLGPFWVWLYINETPAYSTLIGGFSVITAVIIYVWSEIQSKR